MENVDIKTRLVDQLSAINRQIGKFMEQRRKTGGLTQPEGFKNLGDLNLNKNSLLVSILELRRQGENSIELEITGREEDALHPYSRNHVCVAIGKTLPYITRSDLFHLRGVYTGDLLSLIGRPDRFTKESCDAYIIRTMVEMNEIGHVADRNIHDRSVKSFMREVDLNRLKIELVTRLLRLRVAGQVTAEDLIIDYLRDPRGEKNRDLVEIRYFNNHERWGSHIVADEYRRNNTLQRLVEACGGFDRIGRRKKHY